MIEPLDVLAHELRAPVAVLSAFAETITARAVPEEHVHRLLELALAAGRDIERLLRDAAPDSVRRQAIDVEQLVLDTAATATLQGVAVRAEVEPDLPVLRGDPTRLRQALSNLVENAWAHTPAGADVLLAAGTRDERLELSVTDVGDGIPHELQAQIFQPGVRFDTRPGRGIGLALARAIASAHGGELKVESAPGMGATFTLVLPPSGEPA